MLKYSRMLLNTFFKKKSIYITLVIAALACFVISFPALRSANNSGEKYIDSISTFDKFFPFVFGAVFVSTIVLHVFKSGESDGSELLVVSKPITRKEIILSKFSVSFLLVFAFQFFIFIVYLIIGSLDKEATTSNVISYALSFGLGGLIVMTILTSIIVIFSAFFNKVGVTIITILIAAFIPIISFTLVPLGKGWGGRALDINESSKAVLSRTVNDSNNNILYQDYENYDGYTIPESIYDIDEDSFNDLYKDYKDTNWYGRVAPFDLWYQWGRFYSLFVNDKSSDENAILEFTYNSGETINPAENVLKISVNTFAFNVQSSENVSLSQINNNEEYVQFINMDRLKDQTEIYIESENWDFESLKTLYKSVSAAFIEAYSSQDVKFNSFKDIMNSNRVTLYQKIQKISDVISSVFFPTESKNISIDKNSNFDEMKNEIMIKLLANTNIFSQEIKDQMEITELEIQSELSNPNYSDSSIVEVTNQLESNSVSRSLFWGFPIFNELVNSSVDKAPANVLIQYPISSRGDILIEDIKSQEQLSKNKYISRIGVNNFNYLVSKPWVSTTTVVIAWVLIGLLTTSAATWIYFKRDFK